MKVFRSIEVAEWCYLSEAIELLAFGKVPEAEYLEDSKFDDMGRAIGTDRRFHWAAMPDNFETSWPPFDVYDPDDFRAAGIDMPEGYMQAAISIVFGDIADAYRTVEYYEHHREIKKRYDTGIFDDLDENHKAAKEIIKNAGPVEILYEETQKKFDMYLDTIWAKVFSAIQTGAITVEAVDTEKWNRTVESEGYENAGVFVPVPPQAFMLKHDYSQSAVSFDGVEFAATRVRVGQVADFLQTPFTAGEEISARLFGQTVFVNADSRGIALEPAKKRKRGAPPAVDWDRMAQKLRELEQDGTLPEKKEACIQELIDYSERVLGRRVGRTTVQSSMREHLDRLYAR